MSFKVNRNFFIILTLLFTVNSRLAYSQSIDSVKLDTLISVLTYEQENVRTVNAYLSLSEEYVRSTEYENGLTYAILGRDLANKIGDQRGELDGLLAIAHLNLAYYLDFEKSLEYYDEALILAEALDSDKDRVSVYRGLTAVYASVENYQTALAYNTKAISIARNSGDDRQVSDLSAYGGDIYEELGDSAKAMEMYQEVVDIEKSNNFSETSNASLAIVGHYYFLKGDVDKSLKHYRSALTRFERLQDWRWVSYLHSEIATVMNFSGDLDRAEKHALKGLSIAQELDLNKERGDSYYVLAAIYRSKGDDENAIKYQSAYDDLMDSVLVKLEDREIPNTDNELGISKDSSILKQGLINCLIILVIMSLLVLFQDYLE